MTSLQGLKAPGEDSVAKRASDHAQDVSAGVEIFKFRVPSVLLVAAGGWIGRGIQVCAQLVAIRILMDGLGVKGYGVFAVLASLNGWIILSDFGIGISVQNYISERRAAGEDPADIILTGTLLAFFSVLTISLLLILLGPVIADLILGNFQFLSSSDRTYAFYALAAPGIGAALSGVVYRVWFAEHRGYLSNLVPAAGTVIGTAGVWLLQYTKVEPRLPLTILFYYAPLALLPMICLAFRIIWVRRQHRFRADLARPILRRAFSFWVFGLLAAAVLQVDYIIMVRVLPVQDIVVYSVASKIFMMISFVYSALLLALWPVCSEAIVHNKWADVKSIVKKYMVIGVAFVVASSAVVVVTNHWIVRLLAPGLDGPIPLIVIGLLSVYSVLRVWTDTFAMILQSMNDLKLMWIAAPIQAILSIALQTLGARWFGLPGAIGGLIGCFLLTAAWILPLRCWFHARNHLAAR